MAQLPTISIVTPSYQQADFLEACIDSVLSQGYPALEYIIIDGGSDDGSVEIIKNHEKHLHYWHSRADAGQYHAINEGFTHAGGEVMAWLNSDDMYHADALLKVADAFLSRPKVQWLTGRHTFWTEQGEFEGMARQMLLWSPRRLVEYLRDGTGVVQQESTFWRQQLWNDAGGHVSTEFDLAGDFELWCRFALQADLYTMNAALGGFRRHPAQKTANRQHDYRQQAEAVLDKYEDSLMQRNASPPSPLHANPARLNQLRQMLGMPSTQGTPGADKGL